MNTKMMSQDIDLNLAKSFLNAFMKRVEIPMEYRPYSIKKVLVDKIPSYLFRYEKSSNQGIMGEHFSFLVSEHEKQILGFTRMDKTYANREMLSDKDVEAIAKDFLTRIDSRLADDLENLWIKQHDEEIRTENGAEVTISGMKYKCFNPSRNDYAWVIVGFDGTIITFERNIKWNNGAQQRITEKWLHDSWIKE